MWIAEPGLEQALGQQRLVAAVVDPVGVAGARSRHAEARHEHEPPGSQAAPACPRRSCSTASVRPRRAAVDHVAELAIPVLVWPRARPGLGCGVGYVLPAAAAAGPS